MKIAPFVIERFAKFVVGGVPFEAAKGIVGDLNSHVLTGEEKRQHAVQRLAQFGYGLAGFLLNLAVELAVAWVKSKEGKL